MFSYHFICLDMTLNKKSYFYKRIIGVDLSKLCQKLMND